MAPKLTITHLSHDLVAGNSFISYVWAEDPTKRLGLEVPFGTRLEDVETAARRAIDDLAGELSASQLAMP